MSPIVTIHPEVSQALADGRAVVALESTILAHGLPSPDNRRIADEIEGAVRAGGAVPATIAIFDGVVHVGLTPSELDRLCATGEYAGSDEEFTKLSVRDLGTAVALGRSGATTVASTSVLAHRAGIAVFATGGLGGVHRGWEHNLDISADLSVIGHTPVLVVCAGVKSILDVPATLEYLETASVPVLGYRTDAFPGFYLSDSGLSVTWRVESPAEAAAVVLARRELGLDNSGVVLANPLPQDRQLDKELHDRLLADGLAMLKAEGVSGKDVTPRLLEFFHHSSGGESLRANVELVLSNARVAAEVAVAIAGADSAGSAA